MQALVVKSLQEVRLELAILLQLRWAMLHSAAARLDGSCRPAQIRHLIFEGRPDEKIQQLQLWREAAELAP